MTNPDEHGETGSAGPPAEPSAAPDPPPAAPAPAPVEPTTVDAAPVASAPVDPAPAGAAVVEERRLASFGSRLAAFILDATIGVLLLGLGPLAGAVGSSNTGEGPTISPGGLAVSLGTAGLLQYLYFVELVVRQGRTLGKRTCGVAIVPVEPGARLRRSTLLIRWATQWLPALCVPAWVLLDGLWQLGDHTYRQCLHDRAARTIVVRVSA
ncbi:hypothetical protein GCM10010123_29910 [Pilimelia anulata]|uniref:RDD domain-containing protein n=1 Tax=Pilimelia anulata TaxID=53371 RepID=A0A8J3B915_9ACTN|nr:RDD family protein [Pilimelia anulata]GGJ97846.1 hypothetical protein GCM10010123_29910 [Pilimelia anulata]